MVVLPLAIRESMLFMYTMLLHVLVSSPLYGLISWEYLGLLSFGLIQYWGSRALAVLGSIRSLVYNRLLDMMVIYMVFGVLAGCRAP